MKLRNLFGGLLFFAILTASGADVAKVMIDSRAVGDAGLRQSAGVFARRLAARAPRLTVVSDSAAPKPGELSVRIAPYDTANAGTKPEGYRLRIARHAAGGMVAEVTGADRRGVLFGLGALYRKMALTATGVALRECDESSAPRYELRSVNNPIPTNMDGSMIQATGARKWTPEESMAYQEELFLLGQNGITHGWGAAVPVDFARYDGKKGVTTKITDMTAEYGMLYVLACSINGLGRNNMKPEWRAELFRVRSEVHACPSVPEARAALVAAREIAARHAASVDYVMLLPGDVAGCECERCRPWETTYYQLALEMAKAIHREKPGAKVLLSNQEFRKEQNRRFFDLYRRDASPEFTGCAYGPGCSENSFYGGVDPAPHWNRYPGVSPQSTFLKSRLNYLAPGQQVLALMDIGHWKRSQTGLTEIDPAYSEVFERRSFNVCPERLEREWRAVLPYISLGIGYSETIFDDFGKFFTLRLLWNPDLNARQITREYAALYCGENVADLLAEAMLLHEKNVERNMADNGEQILRCHRMVETVWSRMSPEYRRDNWRFGLFRQRAAFDAWLWTRMRAQQQAYDRVIAKLEHDAPPSRAAIAEMIQLLEAAGQTPEATGFMDIMTECDRELDRQAGLKSIALQRLRKRPDNVGCDWLIARLKRIAEANGADARRLLAETVRYDRVGDGEFYDNCGTPGKMPHFDPASGESYYGSGQMRMDSRPSQRSYVFSSEAQEGVRFAYTGLARDAAYRVEFVYPTPDGVTFALNSPNEFEVWADGVRIGACAPRGMSRISPTSADKTKTALSPPLAGRDPFQRFGFDIPRELTADGKLEIRFRKVPGKAVSTCISEIWIQKQAERK